MKTINPQHPAIEVERLSKTFPPRKKALKEISLQVQEGETQAQTNSAVRCMDDDTVRSFLNRITSLGVTVIRKPETGLLMMNVTDCFNTDFHLGEVLVTSAEVKLKGIKGWGMSMGDAGDRAILLACLDALSRCRESDFLLELKLLIRPWIEKAEAQQQEELKMAAATKVNFESMVTEE